VKKNILIISSAFPFPSVFFYLLLFISLFFKPAYAEDYIQVPAATDLRTEFSDGVYSVEELAKLAISRGIEILVINDHDRYSLEYGFCRLRGF